MEKLFITYEQSGKTKKAVVDSQRYGDLRRDPSVTNIVTYPNEIIMENNYRTIVTGQPGNKNILFG